jgi:hypothetical protein
MTECLFGFSWSVPVSGFRWSDFVEREEWRTDEPVLVYDHMAPRRTFEPLRDERALFRNFAETEPKPDSILAFANRYGLLGKGVESSASFFHKQGGRERPEAFWVEGLSAWQQAILRFRFLVTLWQLARTNDRKGLERFISWNQGRVNVAEELYDGFFGPVSLENCVSEAKVERGDTIGAALVIVQTHLNYALGEFVSPWLYWDTSARRSRLSFRVPSLWAAILLQFAEAVGGSHNYQRCAACSQWFELAPGINRANRLTCSDSCRQRFYRLRQDRAVELHQQGKTVREIARALGSDVATVKGWINKRKER